MNQEQINKDLATKKCGESPFQAYVRNQLRNYLKASSEAMGNYWPRWDESENIYRAWRMPDKEDEEQARKGKPVKLIVPISYAQTQTFLSFIYSTFTQRDYVYELRGRTAEDQRYKEGMEIDLQYQLEAQQFLLKLFFLTLDAAKYGFCVVKNYWDTRYEKVRSIEQQIVEPSIFGRLLGRPASQSQLEVVRDIVAYEGNFIDNISPYNFYPDPSLPVARFQQGEFVGHEEEVSLVKVRNLEGRLYHGTDKINNQMMTEDWSYRPKRRVGSRFFSSLTGTAQDLKGSCILAEVIFYSSPAELSRISGMDFGQEKETRRYIATMANDDKIIRFEEYNYLHGNFGYAVGEYSPDHNSFINPGLTDTIYELQNIITWFINSHVSNVRRVLANRFIGDPNKVHVEDVTNESLLIRVKSNSGGIKNSIEQLNVQDVTSNHIKDVEALHKIVQLVTGINDNALGQYATGRRSATESRSVSAGAAARLKMHAQLLYAQCLEPLGRMMIANTRQGRSKEIYANILGENLAQYPYEQVILTPPDRVMGGYDFIPYDATLPTDKIQQANILKELFTVLISNPNTIQLLNKNPMLLLDHIAELLGIRNLKDFNLQQMPVQQPMVVPDQQAMEMAQASGAEPVDMMGADVLQQLAQ